jgi:pimeloyl-ACP methyl ester carboxylesterase
MTESGLDGRACFEAINGPAPGKFVKTEHGMTHYVLEGPESGQLVLLQHGLGSHLGIFDKIAADLVIMGMRVLRFDFYDRGYSETDPERYPVSAASHSLEFTLDLYTQQVRDVVTALGFENQDYIYCGHSTGGVAGIGYASKYSENLKGLLLASSVCLPASKPLAARVADLPIIGSLIVKYFGAKAMIKFATSSCKNPDEFPEVQEFLEKLGRNVRTNKRYFASIRSTNAHCKGFVGSAEEEFRQFCKSKVPLHMIWGRADASVPYSQCLALKKIAEEEGLEEVTEKSFDGIPHNVFFVDAKAEEGSQSVCDFVSKLLK